MMGLISILVTYKSNLFMMGLISILVTYNTNLFMMGLISILVTYKITLVFKKYLFRFGLKRCLFFGLQIASLFPFGALNGLFSGAFLLLASGREPRR